MPQHTWGVNRCSPLFPGTPDRHSNREWWVKGAKERYAEAEAKRQEIFAKQRANARVGVRVLTGLPGHPSEA